MISWEGYIHYFQSTETGSAQAMELEGFKRCRAEMEQAGLKAVSITTDQHLSIAKYIRESWQTVVHYFDTWHVSKGKTIKEITGMVIGLQHHQTPGSYPVDLMDNVPSFILSSFIIGNHCVDCCAWKFA